MSQERRRQDHPLHNFVRGATTGCARGRPVSVCAPMTAPAAKTAIQPRCDLQTFALSQSIAKPAQLLELTQAAVLPNPRGLELRPLYDLAKSEP